MKTFFVLAAVIPSWAVASTCMNARANIGLDGRIDELNALERVVLEQTPKVIASGQRVQGLAALDQLIRRHPSNGQIAITLAVEYAKMTAFRSDDLRALEEALCDTPTLARTYSDLYLNSVRIAAEHDVVATSHATKPATTLAPVDKVLTPDTQAVSVPVRPAPLATAHELPDPPPVQLNVANSARDEQAIAAALVCWTTAWSRKDMDGYFAAYVPGFALPGKANKVWRGERQARMLGKLKIVVTLAKVDISVQKGQASARFVQTYASDGLEIQSDKVLTMVKTGEKWLIAREVSKDGPIKRSAVASAAKL